MDHRASPGVRGENGLPPVRRVGIASLKPCNYSEVGAPLPASQPQMPASQPQMPTSQPQRPASARSQGSLFSHMY